MEGLERISYTEQRVDNVTVQVNTVTSNDPNSTVSNPQPPTSTTNINVSRINTNGLVTSSSSVTLPGTSPRVQTVLNRTANIPTSASAVNSIANNPTGDALVKSTFVVENQFDQSFGVVDTDNNGNFINTIPQFSGAIAGSIQSGNNVIQTLPGNVGRVVVLTNTNQADIANAITEVQLLQQQFPSIQIGIASSVDRDLGNHAVSVIFNPTQQNISNMNLNWVMPFQNRDGRSTAPPLRAPILPLSPQ